MKRRTIIALAAIGVLLVAGTIAGVGIIGTDTTEPNDSTEDVSHADVNLSIETIEFEYMDDDCAGTLTIENMNDANLVLVELQVNESAGGWTRSKTIRDVGENYLIQYGTHEGEQYRIYSIADEEVRGPIRYEATGECQITKLDGGDDER